MNEVYFPALFPGFEAPAEASGALERLAIVHAELDRDARTICLDAQADNYITEKRMAKAKELLVLKGYCPREIATEIGYDNEYSFKRAFQRTYGITPRDFLEKEGKNAR